MTYQPAPVRQGVRSWDPPGGQVLPEERPRFQRGRETFRNRRNVEEHRFASLAHGKAAQLGRIHARRTEQLGRRAKVVQAVRVLAQAKSDPDFFIGDQRIVRRERWIESPLVMPGTTLHRGLEEPLWQTILRTAGARQADGQT